MKLSAVSSQRPRVDCDPKSEILNLKSEISNPKPALAVSLKFEISNLRSALAVSLKSEISNLRSALAGREYGLPDKQIDLWG
jgi:hypothetical protein